MLVLRRIGGGGVESNKDTGGWVLSFFSLLLELVEMEAGVVGCCWLSLRAAETKVDSGMVDGCVNAVELDFN